jgi:hypothetical protein
VGQQVDTFDTWPPHSTPIFQDSLRLWDSIHAEKSSSQNQETLKPTRQTIGCKAASIHDHDNYFESLWDDSGLKTIPLPVTRGRFLSPHEEDERALNAWNARQRRKRDMSRRVPLTPYSRFELHPFFSPDWDGIGVELARELALLIYHISCRLTLLVNLFRYFPGH